MTSEGSTEWQKTTTHVGGRLVVLARGTKTQTVNVCTADNAPGSYEFRYRLPIDVDIEPGDLSELDGLEALRQFLETHNGTPETPGGSQPAQVPTLVPPLPVDDPWLRDAAAAAERALDKLVEEFRKKPYLHRVEHSLHAWLHALLLEEGILAEEVKLKSGEDTQLIHKEWPETVPGGPVARRGSFDLAVLAPEQLRQATLTQFQQGRISAPIVIEVGLDYGLWHLQQDMQKLLNSGVPCPYVVHLSRVPIKSDKQQQLEDALRQASSPIKSAYVHIDARTGATRYKRVGQAEIATTMKGAVVPDPDGPLDDILSFALTYNGYKRIGEVDEVSKATEPVRSVLQGTGSPPPDADLDSLRAALFFIQRQTHHWGDVPPEEERQMRGLVRAISALSAGDALEADDF